MNVFKIQNEIEKLVTELKKVAKENEVSIYVDASPYESIIDTVRIFDAKDIRSSLSTIDVIYEKTNEEINTVFKYIKLPKKEETA
jgi:hypothetical protein